MIEANCSPNIGVWALLHASLSTSFIRSDRRHGGVEVASGTLKLASSFHLFWLFR